MNQQTPAVQFAAITSRTPRTSLCNPAQLPDLCKNAGHHACIIADPGWLNSLHPLARTATESGIHPVFGLLANLQPKPAGTTAWPLPQDPAAMLLARGPEGLSLLMQHSSTLLTRKSTSSSGIHRPRIKHELLQPHPELAILPIGPKAIELLADRATAALIPDFAAEPFSQPHARAALHAAHDANLPAIPWLPILAPTPTATYREALAVLWADHANATWEGACDALPSSIHPLPADQLRQRYAAWPRLLENAANLAVTCNAMPQTMQHPPPDAATATELASQARTGLIARFQDREVPAHYAERLETELAAIASAGWSNIFLVMKSFLDEQRQRGILIGPGRGSAAGSLVSWSLGITVPDPIENGLIFERFINPDRISPPDFDIDFPSHAQLDAQNALRTLWGHDRSAAISGITTYGPRQAYVSSAKRRGVTHPRVQRSLASLAPRAIPSNPSDPNLKRAAADAATLSASSTAYAVTLHPAAIALAPQPWSGIIPAYPADRGDTLQTDHVESEDAGLVKIDCLALSTLDALERAQRASQGPHPWTLPQDPAVYAALAAGRTHGVFQLDGEGITLATQSIRPTRFDDLRAILALYRPGALEHLESYAARAKNLERPEPPHPLMHDALSETHGLIVYQEQAMATAMTLASFTPAEADALRRAIGKKKPDEMQALRQRFLEGCDDNGVSAHDAETIWQQLEAHAGYSFNKAHATCYALISYATAFYALHHPDHWLTALADTTMLDPKPQAPLKRIAAHAALLRIPVLPPDPLRAAPNFILDRSRTSNHAIRAPLHAIPGWGKTLARNYLAALEAQNDRRRPKAQRIAENLEAISATARQKTALIAACAPNPDAALRLQVEVDRNSDPPPPSWPYTCHPFPAPDEWKAQLIRSRARPIDQILHRVHIPDPSIHMLHNAYRTIALVSNLNQGKYGARLDLSDPTGTLRLRMSQRDAPIDPRIEAGVLCFANLSIRDARISILDISPLDDATPTWPAVLILRFAQPDERLAETAMALLKPRSPGFARIEWHIRLDINGHPSDAANPQHLYAVLPLQNTYSVDNNLLATLRQTIPALQLEYYPAPRTHA